MEGSYVDEQQYSLTSHPKEDITKDQIAEKGTELSNGIFTPRDAPQSEMLTERADNDDEEEDEEGGLDELIIMDEDEQAAREN